MWCLRICPPQEVLDKLIHFCLKLNSTNLLKSLNSWAWQGSSRESWIFNIQLKSATNCSPVTWLSTHQVAQLQNPRWPPASWIRGWSSDSEASSRFPPPLQTMHAHSQFCMSGDYTLEAADASIRALAREEADEHFVVVLSDANLERYGIRPERFARVLTSDPQVNAFAIFIGSLGDQAERYWRSARRRCYCSSTWLLYWDPLQLVHTTIYWVY